MCTCYITMMQATVYPQLNIQKMYLSIASINKVINLRPQLLLILFVLQQSIISQPVNYIRKADIFKFHNIVNYKNHFYLNFTMYCTAKLLYLNFTILYYEMQFEQNKMRYTICTVSDNNYHISCQVMFTFPLKFYLKKFFFFFKNHISQ